MPRFLAWGCNITGSLDPTSAESFLPVPTDITEAVETVEILWTGWAGTVGRSTRGIKVWGSSNLLGGARVKELDIGPVRRILGFDTIRGWLDDQGSIHDLGCRLTSARWDDVTISGLGVVYAFRRTDGLYISQSMDVLFADMKLNMVVHPALNPAYPAKVYSMESRAFLHTLGPMQQLFEIVMDDKGKPCDPRLVPIDDLEGMGLEIVPGSCNRLGILTDTGAAYALEQRSREVEMLDVEGDVRLLGLGSNFDVVVVGDKVFTKGDNEYGQLGRTGQTEWAEAEVDVQGKVVDVECSRWGTILTLDAS